MQLNFGLSLQYPLGSYLKKENSDYFSDLSARCSDDLLTPHPLLQLAAEDICLGFMRTVDTFLRHTTVGKTHLHGSTLSPKI